MRKYIVIALCALLTAACVKKTNPVTPNTPNQPSTPNNPNPNPTPTTARFIPNWQRDTLTGGCVDVNGHNIIDSNGLWVIDTIITYTVNDTSFIEHQGVRYYLWWNPAFNTDTFVNNEKTYGNCAVSTTKDTSGIVNQYNVGAFPHRYWDKFYNDWGHQKQTLLGHSFHPTYKVWNSYYVSIK